MNASEDLKLPAAPAGRPRYSPAFVFRGLLVATLAVGLTSILAAAVSAAIGLPPNIFTIISLGLLLVPAIGIPILAFVVFLFGTPVCVIANARGWTRYRHAVIAGSLIGILMSLVGVALGQGAFVLTPIYAQVFNFNTLSLLGLGVVGGIAARFGAGPPTLRS
ncbi:MAG: hypothetical protein Q8R02_00640 [Hyphomonadaceae bacterium]|nr:hypothetical protein [Hyphomonadaceae bacterium]